AAVSPDPPTKPRRRPGTLFSPRGGLRVVPESGWGMPLAADRLLFPPGWRVTRTALKYSGVSTTLGSLVAAKIVRVIAGALGVVCAVAGSAIAVAWHSTVANIIIRTVQYL